MSPARDESLLPLSGAIVGMIVKAFRLDDAEIGGPSSTLLNATTDKTAQRLFAGTRIDHERADALVREFGKALFYSGLFGSPAGSVQCLERTLPWEEVYVDAVAAYAKIWDSEFGQAAAKFPRADHRISALIFARQVIIELALRYVVMIRLGIWQRPSEETPWWATGKGFGSFLKRIRSSCPRPPSRSALAKAIGADDSTVDRWFAGKEIPSLVYADDLALAFGKALSNRTADELLVEFRRAVGIASLMGRFRNVVGDEALGRLGKAMHRFVRWSLEITDRGSSAAEELEAESAATMIFGTANPSSATLLEAWAMREEEVPWRDDILWSHPTHRPDRILNSLRVIGEGERTKSAVREAIPHLTDSELQLSMELAAAHTVSTPRLTQELAAKLESGEYKVFRITGDDSTKARNRMIQAEQSANVRDFETACSHARRAVYLQPEREDYRYFFGAYLWQAKQFDEGLEQLRRACELKPEWDRPFVEIAIAYYHWGRSDMAKSHLDGCPDSIRSRSEFFHLTRARICWERREFGEVLASSEYAIGLNASLGEAWDLAARCAFILGDRRKGERYAKEAKHRGVLQAYDWWQSGEYGPL